MIEKVNDFSIEKKVVKRNGEFCVIHTKPPKAGQIIKCFKTKKEAEAMHQAIMIAQAQRKSDDVEKNVKASYFSKGKPFYRSEYELLEEDLKKLNWLEQELIVDSKVDGLRISLGVAENKPFIWVDPIEIKKEPSVGHRLPIIIKELESFPNNTVFDAEFFVMKDNSVLHRTNSNALLNTKVDANKFIPFTYVYVFDIIYFKNKKLTDLSLEDRLKILNTLKSTEHIIIIKPSDLLKSGYSAYRVKGIKQIKKAWTLLTNNKGLKYKNKFVKYFVEGILIKRLNHSYVQPQNKGWMKCKRWSEIDCVVIDRILVKGAKKTWNYKLGINLTKEYVDKLLEDKKGKKSIIQVPDKWLLYIGKSDNTNLDVKNGDILRVASEEVIRYENEVNPDYPFYKLYISRAMQSVPEKNVSDSLDTLYRLSLLEPKRIPVEELVRLKGIEDNSQLMKYVDYIKSLEYNKLKEFYVEFINKLYKEKE